MLFGDVVAEGRRVSGGKEEVVREVVSEEVEGGAEIMVVLCVVWVVASVSIVVEEVIR